MDDVSTINLKLNQEIQMQMQFKLFQTMKLFFSCLEITIDEESGFLSICYPISYFETIIK